MIKWEITLFGETEADFAASNLLELIKQTVESGQKWFILKQTIVEEI